MNGTYRILEEIGAGGMARVHLAVQRGGPLRRRRAVAIKRLHPELARDEGRIAMLLDEARLVSRISHPNVVPFLDVLVEGDAVSLVMEYVHGEALSALLRRARASGEPIPVPIAVAIVCDLLRGLHAAHDARGEGGDALELVHRDVSPENVIVGACGTSKLLDFGVAKAVGRLQSTREGGLKGKLAYMAPEQVQREPVDRRTDVYAASVVLWELLTNRALYAGDSEASVLEQVLLGFVDPPSAVVAADGFRFFEREPSRLDAVRALDDLVLRGLSRAPEARFPSAEAMATALESATPRATAATVASYVATKANPALAARAARVADAEGRREPGASRLGAFRALTLRVAFAAFACAGACSLAQIGGADAKRVEARSAFAEPPRLLRSGTSTALREASASEAFAVAAVGDYIELDAVDFELDEPQEDVRRRPDGPSDPARARLAVRVPRTPPRDAARARAAPRCDPPFVRDDLGRKIYKRECLGDGTR
jgi:serine/threonine-protein kinase